jgi:hypothetical protein
MPTTASAIGVLASYQNWKKKELKNGVGYQPIRPYRHIYPEDDNYMIDPSALIKLLNYLPKGSCKLHLLSVLISSEVSPEKSQFHSF